MKRANQITAVFVFLVGALAVLLSREHEYMVHFTPGPGFFPIWLGICLMGLATTLFIQSSLDKKESQQMPPKIALAKPVKILIGMALFVLLGRPLGLLLTIGLFMAYIFIFIEKATIYSSIFIAITTSLFFYLLFEVGLKIRLPVGILGI